MTGPYPDDEDLTRWAEQAMAAEGDPALRAALAALHRIAVAAGVYEATWQAASLSEVGEIIAAWCLARRGLHRDAGVVECRAWQPVAAGQDVEVPPGGSGLVAPARQLSRRYGVAVTGGPVNALVYVRLDPPPAAQRARAGPARPSGGPGGPP